jgi:hypothetical protein
MVSPLFTAFAMIAAGRVEVPPVPPRPVPVPEIRGYVSEREPETDRLRRR